MELDQIRYFIKAAQHQNLSRAAQALNITQPALSKSISKLEDELGVKLFDRYGKKILLNENGERLLEHAIKSLDGLDGAVAAVKNQTTSQSLYLGIFHRSEIFLRCLGEFAGANPNVGFQLECLELASHVIDTNEFDMLIYPQSPRFSKYKGERIYTEPYLLAVHKSHSFADRDSVNLSDVAGQKVVFIKNDRKDYDLPYQMCLSLDVRTNSSIFTNSYEIQRWFVSNNHGIGFVPQGSSACYTADPDVVLLPVTDENLSQEIMIGFKREKHLSAAGKRFAAFVRAYFAHDVDLVSV